MSSPAPLVIVRRGTGSASAEQLTALIDYLEKSSQSAPPGPLRDARDEHVFLLKAERHLLERGQS